MNSHSQSATLAHGPFCLRAEVWTDANSWVSACPWQWICLLPEPCQGLTLALSQKYSQIPGRVNSHALASLARVLLPFGWQGLPKRQTFVTYREESSGWRPSQGISTVINSWMVAYRAPPALEDKGTGWMIFPLHTSQCLAVLGGVRELARRLWLCVCLDAWLWHLQPWTTQAVPVWSLASELPNAASHRLWLLTHFLLLCFEQVFPKTIS